MIEGNVNNFDEVVREKSHDKVVLVKFWAEWCVPCKRMTEQLEQIDSEVLKQIDIVSIDVDASENHKICSEFGVRNIPTLLVYHRGQIKERWVGVNHSISELQNNILKILNNK